MFAAADVTIAEDLLYPRVHPAPLETCGAIADFDVISGKLTVWSTSQAPHPHRLLYAMVAGVPEHKIRVISPDIGGGFGNKVPIYPGYLCAVVGSIVTGRPVKWIEDRSENLMSTSFARDYHMHGEIAATRDGKILAVRVRVLADHGAFNGAAQPTKFPAGFFGVFTGSYDLQAAHCQVTGVYTNKAPGGVAYSCSFRITEAVYLVERMVDMLAFELDADPAELRMKNLLRPDQFPYTCATGWVYDSGDYARTLQLALDKADYPELRREQAARRERGELMGIGLSFFTEAVGPARASTWTSSAWAWPTRWSCGCTRPAPPCCGSRCRARARGTRPRSPRSWRRSWVSRRTSSRSCTATLTRPRSGWAPTGPGPPRCPGPPPRWPPAGSGTRPAWSPRPCSRCPPTTWNGRRAAGSYAVTPTRAARSPRSRWRPTPTLSCRTGSRATWTRAASTTRRTSPTRAAPTSAWSTWTPGTGKVNVRRFIAVDDCGVRINPMIVEGQIHGGLADGVGMALMEVITYDTDGNCLGGSFMDYLLPTAVECPSWELGETVTPSPHHPIGAKGVGESATVGSPPAVVNAVIDALKPFGVRHADMPLTPAQVWRAIQGRPLRTDLAEP